MHFMRKALGFFLFEFCLWAQLNVVSADIKVNMRDAFGKK